MLNIINRSSFVVSIFITLILCFVPETKVSAHPGSGIVLDKEGNIYFTDTGKGVWKIDTQGKLSFLPASKFHWMTIDAIGHFAGSQKNFGEYFERVTPKSSKPALIMCSDFPLVVNMDGNIYYANTRSGSAKIIKRTPDGKESVFASNKIFQFINGITAGADGSLYITESSNANANTIRKITMDGTITIIATFVGKTSNDLPLETVPSYCRGLAVDPAGSIYVAATGSRSVLKISPQGKVTTILQATSPWTPTGVAVFNGEVYILEWHDVSRENLEVRSTWIPRVRKIGSDGKVITLATVSR
ncbi:MAG TPA: SMP-30/gluconolactonase/LRE family protein [Chitinophagaceae bacterium]|nr:SMP-30/gluconolactonase/LRE family protein [Chitinophagaceae bacterium]